MDGTFGINCNVTITSKDLKGNTLYKIQKHNKATRNMVDGILRFLKGDFTETEYNMNPVPSEAKLYTPTRVKLGTPGITIGNGTGEYEGKRVLVDYVTPISTGGFNNTTLEREVPYETDPIASLFPTIKFERMRQTYNTSVGDTERLLLSLYIPPGKTVGALVYDDDKKVEVFKPFEHSYFSSLYNGYCATFTEVGLFSSTGVLLARVVLDGDWEYVYKLPDNDKSEVISNADPSKAVTVLPKEGVTNGPIYQTQYNTLQIEWRIDLTSIGSNDVMYNESNI